MARDNSPKERQKKQLERKLGRRASHDRLLIVSEGSKTEPNYFREIRTAYRLHTANVEVQPSEMGTSPLQVVQYAKELFEKGDRHRQIQPRAFEQVYAVFDRDDHATYFQALELAKSLDGKLRNDIKQPMRFQAIASVPSFELWLLLHYEDIRAPIHRVELMQRLKQHLPHYEKG
nr:RloB domain-containing protein [Giesbergeria sp.]